MTEAGFLIWRRVGEQIEFRAKPMIGIGDGLMMWIVSTKKRWCPYDDASHEHFGIGYVDDDHAVRRFRAQPKSEGWVSSGFSVFNRHVLHYLDLHSVFEREPLEVLARDKELGANEHSGFFRSNDTNWRFFLLNEFWVNGDRQWAVWTR